MEDKKGRKATDIVLKLEHDVQEIKALIRNLDNNVKIMLSRLNDSIKTKPAPSVVAPVEKPPQSKRKLPPGPSDGPKTLEDLKHTNKFEQAMARYGLEPEVVRTPIESNAPPSQPPVALDDDLGLIEEVVHTGQRRVQRVATGSGGKVSVQQQIVAESGAPIFLASVEIFDSNRELIKQTRTNTKGVWRAALEPGPYIIHVSKREFGPSKKAVELQFDVTINSTDKVELDSPVGIEG